MLVLILPTHVLCPGPVHNGVPLANSQFRSCPAKGPVAMETREQIVQAAQSRTEPLAVWVVCLVACTEGCLGYCY